MYRAFQQLKSLPNVTGCFRGYKMVGGRRTAELAVVVTVSVKVSPAQLRATQLVPKTFEGLPTDVLQVGIVSAPRPIYVNPLELIDTAPPIRLGRSCGGDNVTAGSVGGVVRFDGQPAIISNNHVLAAQNLNPLGSPAYYPGLYDQKVAGDYKVGALANFVPLQFLGGELPTDCNIAKAVVAVVNFFLRANERSTQLRAVQPKAEATNTVDGAVAVLNPGVEWDRECEIYSIARANLGDPAYKLGRTTERTPATGFGQCDGVDVTQTVQYGEGKLAVLTDQWLSYDITSAGGDSGSSARAANDPGQLKGVLFAGGEGITLFNQPDNFMAGLGFTLMLAR